MNNISLKLFDDNLGQFLDLNGVAWGFSKVVNGEYDHITICRGTGAVDSEGNEIFEHDVVEFIDDCFYQPQPANDGVYKIVWCDEALRFRIECANGECSKPLDQYWGKELRIIRSSLLSPDKDKF